MQENVCECKWCFQSDDKRVILKIYTYVRAKFSNSPHYVLECMKLAKVLFPFTGKGNLFSNFQNLKHLVSTDAVLHCLTAFSYLFTFKILKTTLKKLNLLESITSLSFYRLKQL